MNPDIIAAIANYMQQIMGQSLLSATGYAQVYTDYAPGQNPDGSPVIQPYAVVTEGSETYSNTQTQDPATGSRLDVLADGMAMIGFYANTKDQARALVRTAVRLDTDTQVAIQAADGVVVTFLPIRADTVPLDQSGIGEPGKFLRVLTVRYIQQFLT